jgi:hypothetical protein
LSLVIPTGAAIFALTIFLDLLEMSFGRILWFMRTLRFWLYFVLHFGISCLAAYLIHSKVTDWYLLALVSTFLGVAIISNTNVKVAGIPLVPIADLFVSIKAKMIDQAGQDKATVLRKAQLVERLQKLGTTKLEAKCSTALIAVGWTPDRIRKRIEKAKGSGKQTATYQENSLIGLLLDTNLDLVEQSIDKWEMER